MRSLLDFKKNDITIAEIEKSGLYRKELVDFLKTCTEPSDIWKLSDVLLKDEKSNKELMKPLFYAVKNDIGTYGIYKYCSGDIQNDDEMAEDIVNNEYELELIKDTPKSKDEKFILNHIQDVPELFEYMSSELKSDEELICTLCKTGNEEIIEQISREYDLSDIVANNPELAQDDDFMRSAIYHDADVLDYASDEIKNDYDYLRDSSAKNEEIVDYVVNNVDSFGLEGIKAVRDTSRDNVTDDCLTLINEMAETSPDGRYKKVKEKIEQCGKDDVRAVRWLTAMVAQSDDLDPNLIKRTLNYSLLTMEKTRKDLTNGEMQINLDNMQELITPQILNKLKEKVEQQGIEIDPEIQQKIDEYTEFYNEYHEKFKEYKRQKREDELKNKKEAEENKDENVVDDSNKDERLSISEVKEKTEDVLLSEVKKEIMVTKEEVRSEVKEGIENKIGELEDTEQYEQD